MSIATPSSPRTTAAPMIAPSADLQFDPQHIVLALILLFEAAIYGVLGNHFLSIENLLTVSVQSVPLGLLALALTPVILTGGIDLSVGSTIGLCAIVFGQLSHDAHLSPLAAGVITMLV